MNICLSKTIYDRFYLAKKAQRKFSYALYIQSHQVRFIFQQKDQKIF